MVEGAEAVPDPEAREVRAQEIERIAQDTMLAAGEVESRSFPRRVPELAAFSLPDGVVGQDEIPPTGQVDVQGLIFRVGLADRGMAARADDAGRGRPAGLGAVQERGD